MPFYPKADDEGSLFAADAASVEDDEMELHWIAPGSGPPSPGVDPWNGPYGLSVTEFTTGNGFPAVGFGGAPGYGATGPKGIKADVQLLDGWYTRISRRDKFSK